MPATITLRKKKSITRQAILTSAAYLFSEFGFKNISMDMIAKKANISRSTMYNFYNSKEDIVIDILDTVYLLLQVISSSGKLDIKLLFDLLKSTQFDLGFIQQFKHHPTVIKISESLIKIFDLRSNSPHNNYTKILPTELAIDIVTNCFWPLFQCCKNDKEGDLYFKTITYNILFKDTGN